MYQIQIKNLKLLLYAFKKSKFCLKSFGGIVLLCTISHTGVLKENENFLSSANACYKCESKSLLRFYITRNEDVKNVSLFSVKTLKQITDGIVNLLYNNSHSFYSDVEKYHSEILALLRNFSKNLTHSK